MDNEEDVRPSLIIAAGIFAGVQVTRIVETPTMFGGKLLTIFSHDRSTKIKRSTMEGFTVNELGSYLKRKLA